MASSHPHSIREHGIVEGLSGIRESGEELILQSSAREHNHAGRSGLKAKVMNTDKSTF